MRSITDTLFKGRTPVGHRPRRLQRAGRAGEARSADPDRAGLGEDGHSEVASMNHRMCSTCRGRCYWVEDAWRCSEPGCGDEWVEDHNLRYAPPWSDDDEQRIRVLRRMGDFGDEYRRLRRLETLEASRRRQRRSASWSDFSP